VGKFIKGKNTLYLVYYYVVIFLQDKVIVVCFGMENYLFRGI